MILFISLLKPRVEFAYQDLYDLYAYTGPDFFFFTKHYTVSKCQQSVKDQENEEGMTCSQEN